MATKIFLATSAVIKQVSFRVKVRVLCANVWPRRETSFFASECARGFVGTEPSFAVRSEGGTFATAAWPIAYLTTCRNRRVDCTSGIMGLRRYGIKGFRCGGGGAPLGTLRKFAARWCPQLGGSTAYVAKIGAGCADAGKIK